jgi:hypothetical protein
MQQNRLNGNVGNKGVRYYFEPAVVNQFVQFLGFIMESAVSYLIPNYVVEKGFSSGFFLW